MPRGRLVYVMGPSGSGKDTLIKHFMDQKEGRENFRKAARYITRISTTGERHRYLSESEFTQRRDNDGFALHWAANGYQYGIGREIFEWLDAGLHIIMNGSRAYYPTARGLFPDLLPILLTASDALLLARLQKRGRECPLDLSQRLRRNQLFDLKNKAGIHIVASGNGVERSVLQLLSHLHSAGIIDAKQKLPAITNETRRGSGTAVHTRSR